MPPFDTILFDLDGTLTDSKEGIIRAIRFALERMGIPCENSRNLDCFVGPPLLDTFRTHFGLSGEHARQAVAAYREYFTEIGMFENALYPGVPEMLAALRDADRRLVLATAKPTPYAEIILKHFHIAQFFSLVVGANLDGTRIHKNEVIAETLAQLAPADRSRLVMVGDREHDILGAREHGIASIGVNYGYGSIAELQAARPAWIVHSVNELQDFLLQGQSVGSVGSDGSDIHSEPPPKPRT